MSETTTNPAENKPKRRSPLGPRKPKPEAPPTLSYLKSEESFLKFKNGHGYRRGQNKVAEALKRNTVAYFRHILDDETERDLWFLFMTGKQAKRDADGNPVMDSIMVNGQERLVPILEEVELNPISWQAFKRAVEYKRGLPIVTVRGEGENGDGLTVKFEMIGASPEFFEHQGKVTGLIPK